MSNPCPLNFPLQRRSDFRTVNFFYFFQNQFHGFALYFGLCKLEDIQQENLHSDRLYLHKLHILKIDVSHFFYFLKVRGSQSRNFLELIGKMSYAAVTEFVGNFADIQLVIKQ